MYEPLSDIGWFTTPVDPADQDLLAKDVADDHTEFEINTMIECARSIKQALETAKIIRAGRTKRGQDG